MPIERVSPGRLKIDPLLFHAAGKLKEIKRRGWVLSGAVRNPESVADHSFRMAIMGAYLSDVKGLDSAKVMRMCLIHDIAESEIGDMTPEEKESEETHRRTEDSVARKIFAQMPLKSKRIFLKDWRELMKRKTEESMLVWEIDKLEMGLTMKDYVKSGSNRRKLERFNPSNYLSKDLKALFEKY
ncbi:MAG: HD domain-containing protein [Nitrososphaerales archaeon]